jgi:SAM-dependent methyltransferase
MIRYLWVLSYCKDKKVVDAACGTGYGTELISRVTDRVLGADISEETIRYATKTNLGSGIKFAIMDFNKVVAPEKDNPCFAQDLIISFETIEHLENPMNFLKWCRFLAPVVIGSIPINCPTEFHKHVLSAIDIQKLVTDSGFSKVTWYTQNEMNITPGLDLNATSGMVLFIARR